jgi:hypothetical protein
MLQLAHSTVLLQCPDIYGHAMKGYSICGRGALLVRFDTVEELRCFVRGTEPEPDEDGGVEESKDADSMVDTNYYDIFTLGHLRSAEVNDCITKYDPAKSFVLITSVVTPERKLAFSVSVSPADAPVRLMLEIMMRETLGIGLKNMDLDAPPPPRKGACERMKAK